MLCMCICCLELFLLGYSYCCVYTIYFGYNNIPFITSLLSCPELMHNAIILKCAQSWDQKVRSYRQLTVSCFWGATISPSKTAILVILASQKDTQFMISPRCTSAPIACAVPGHCTLLHVMPCTQHSTAP